MRESGKSNRPAPSPKIGPIVQRARKARRLTLQQLASRSGVSRSMLSQVERGEANPTFAVLWSLTQALGLKFEDLIADGATGVEQETIELVTAGHTPEIRSADGLCRLRILSPPRLAGQIEWYDVQIAPGGRLESEPHARGAFEHFTAQSGDIEVTSGGSSLRLRPGETARYRADMPHAVINMGKDAAAGFLVLLYQ